MLPLFGELALLLPHTSMTITMFGHEVVKAWQAAPEGSVARARGASHVFDYATPGFFDALVHTVAISLEVGHFTWQASCDAGSHAAPDLVIGPNAGVASYAEWHEVIRRCSEMGITLATSEYSEHMVEREEETVKVILEQKHPVSGFDPTICSASRFFNPLRHPGPCEFSMTKSPHFSNGFVVIREWSPCRG